MTDCLFPDAPSASFARLGGGKASQLARLSALEFRVPPWFCVGAEAMDRFLAEAGLAPSVREGDDLAKAAADVEAAFLAAPFPKGLAADLDVALERAGLATGFVAVRSSGLDEDSKEHSFAGLFSSFLYLSGAAQIADAVKRCWASAYSERALAYRVQKRLPLEAIRMGVVVQRMVNSESAGVAFSRNPMAPLDRKRLVVSSVWGLGEGLVSGELDADHFEVERETFECNSHIVRKPSMFRQGEMGGIAKVDVAEERVALPSLDASQVTEVSKLALACEAKLGEPQDVEWAFADGALYVLQSRPITSLPNAAFFDRSINGRAPILWDNSNIIESYCGVTTPLTFSFASAAYTQVYIQFCEAMGVPRGVISAHDAMFRNMLGLVRGRIYYNLVNWYRLLLMLPGSANNSAFMETMMGVKKGLDPEVKSLFDFLDNPPRYGRLRGGWLVLLTAYRFLSWNTIVRGFQEIFTETYDEARKKDFGAMSLPEQAVYYQHLSDRLLRNWKAPIVNDFLCMIFFGLLKSLTAKWVGDSGEGGSLQNDLLCGEGDLKSTEPTKMLMAIAERLASGDEETREWFLRDVDAAFAEMKRGERGGELKPLFDEFLHRYGFRCVNELKLEEPDLHDDPTFVLHAIAGYLRTGSYSVKAMEEREATIRLTAEEKVRGKLRGAKRAAYFWVVRQARRAVSTRENLRFDRTKVFGIVRHLFRAMGKNLHQLSVIEDPKDVFYLTVEELLAYVEGRPVSLALDKLVAIRKAEFDEYRRTPAPPDRFLSYGASGASFGRGAVLSGADLLAESDAAEADPSVLRGISCCPGVVEGAVRVARDARDAMGLKGEILVTERTDPGWVPLYPSCSGLLIERGSLLSHSAVVARELGLPTIVGIRGGLMTRLKTGDRVRVDAGKGEIRVMP